MLTERMACTPAMTMARLTTIAMTGRRMKRSVSFMAERSLVGRLGRDFDLRRQLVVHDHWHACVQLERAARDDGLAGGQARGDGHQVAAPLAEPHEPLA